MNFVVAIDGPAASGKGTITREIANQLGLTVLPTGDIYRCLALEVLRNGYGMDHVDEIVELAKKLNIQFKNEGDKEVVLLNGNDVSDEIREPAVAKVSSMVSVMIQVREQLTLLQRRMAEGKNIIAEGRDMGTVIFPNADVKLYIDASEEVRAKRRYKEYVSKGIDTTYEKVLEDLRWRDNNDKNKEVGALRKADDAILIDTTEMSIEEAVAQIRNEIEAKRRENNKETTGKNYNSKEHLTNASSFDEYDSFDM